MTLTEARQAASGQSGRRTDGADLMTLTEARPAASGQSGRQNEAIPELVWLCDRCQTGLRGRPTNGWNSLTGDPGVWEQDRAALAAADDWGGPTDPDERWDRWAR